MGKTNTPTPVDVTETRENIIERATREAEAKYPHPHDESISEAVMIAASEKAYIEGVIAEAERRAKDRELLQQLVDVLAEALKGAPTAEPERYDGDNHGDTFYNAYEECLYAVALATKDTLSALKDAGITPTEA